MAEADDLRRENEALKRRIAQLEAENAEIKKRLRELEARLQMNSRNSSKPPSSDWTHRPKPKSLREPSGRPTGGQAGHPGRTLEMIERPDRVVRHAVHACGGCGRSLARQASLGMERRQVFDMPPQEIEVTEHQAEIKVCGDCGQETRGEFPADAQQPAQYGNRLKALSAYLANYQFIPYERQEEFFQDLYGLAISQGTLVNFNQDCYGKLEGAEEAIREGIVRSEVTHHDETGQYIAGKREWLHVSSTARLRTMIFVVLCMRGWGPRDPRISRMTRGVSDRRLAGTERAMLPAERSVDLGPLCSRRLQPTPKIWPISSRKAKAGRWSSSDPQAN